jgi:hypothetical protein
MQTTTPMVNALESIDFDMLATVSGGCHKGCCQPPPAPPAPQQTQIIQMPQAPAAAPPAPSGPQVSTSVSINGQPAA